MNIQLPQVIRASVGETGMAMIRASVAGERDGVKLAPLGNPGCQSSAETIVKALMGAWKDEHLFARKHSLALSDFYPQPIAACDKQIEQYYTTLKPRGEDPIQAPTWPVPKPRRKTNKNTPVFDVDAAIIGLTGVDLGAFGGIGSSLAQTIVSEIGTAMSRWASSQHFTSWLGLAPHHDISGGKVLRARTLATNNRAGQACHRRRSRAKCLWRLLSTQTCQRRSSLRTSGDRSQDCPHRLSLAQRS